MLEGEKRAERFRRLTETCVPPSADTLSFTTSRRPFQDSNGSFPHHSRFAQATYRSTSFSAPHRSHLYGSLTGSPDHEPVLLPITGERRAISRSVVTVSPLLLNSCYRTVLVSFKDVQSFVDRGFHASNRFSAHFSVTFLDEFRSAFCRDAECSSDLFMRKSIAERRDGTYGESPFVHFDHPLWVWSCWLIGLPSPVSGDGLVEAEIEETSYASEMGDERRGLVQVVSHVVRATICARGV